jgi:hypothetical protein
MKAKIHWTIIFIAITSISIFAQIPKVLSNIHYTKSGKLYIKNGPEKYYEKERDSSINLKRFTEGITGTKTGLAFDFGKGLEGTLYYGFIHFHDAKHPTPVFFKRTSSISNGKADIAIIGNLSGRYDMIGWEKTGKGTMGYRIINTKGKMLYEGMISFKGTGPFKVDDTIISGPFVNLVTDKSTIISFETNTKIIASVVVDGNKYCSSQKSTHHEIKIDNLQPAREYQYTVNYGENQQSYSFKTAPQKGSRSAFTFSYASDSRTGQGGGERDLFGTNFYVMRKIMALNSSKDIAFMQFTGDMINGYLSDRSVMDLQYTNWKKSMEPYLHYFPIYVNMGNHEAFTHYFDNGQKWGLSVNRFPYKSESAEKVFADHFVNPTNGPKSEDGAIYDPDLENTDFPSYSENVFFYTYDNIAVVALNSNYWYTPSTKMIPQISGNLHGYIMDKQVEWLKTTIQNLEQNTGIDHIFITEHTPFFPNGGHKGDDMWYSGDNKFRPYVSGKAVKYGIIERRDQLLDIIVNQSKKVVAILTGDEHNYCRLEVGPNTEIYPDNYPEEKKIKLTRTIWQINNGAAGAPYYAQQELPWSPFLKGFTTQNALVFFNVEGKKILMETYNPDTLDKYDSLELR